MLRTTALLAGFSLLTACGALSTDTELSDKAQSALLTDVDWNTQLTGVEPIGSMLELVESAPVTELVKEALINSPSLQQTRLTMMSARTQITSEVAKQLPSFDASLSNRQAKDSQNLFAASINASWEVDLWGRLAASSSAVRLDVLQSEIAFESAKSILAANVMVAAIDVTNNQQLLKIKEQRNTLLEQVEQLAKERYQLGLTNLRDWSDAASAVASSEAELIDRKERLMASRRALGVLVGREFEPGDFDFGTPVVGIPLIALREQTLAHRFDLQIAFAQIKASEKRNEVAYKALLPSFRLSASYSDASVDFSDALFKSPAWSLLSSLSQPLFRGGELRAELERSGYALEKSYWSFQESLLKAVQELNDIMGRDVSLNLQKSEYERALEAAEQSFTSYRESYRHGLATMIELLVAQRALFSIQEQLQSVSTELLKNRVALGLALGMGVEGE